MISIITIVKNDRGVENTLHAVSLLKKPVKSEIIIIDASNGAIDDIKDRYPHVRWYYYSNPNKAITIPEQRNMGVRKAKGNIIVFIDANCVPTSNWLMELYATYVTSDADIVSGPIIPSNENSINNIWHESDDSDYRHECPTGNVLINKSVFSTVGYFDETLSYGEDIDFTWRAVKAGFKIKLNSEALVYHDWGDFISEIKRSFKYGKARIVLYKKHPDRWREILVKDYVAISYTLYILLIPIAVIFPYYFLFLLVPILKNKNKTTFRKTLKLVLLNLTNGTGIIKGLLRNF